MRELIDKLEQLDLQQLSMGDLRWMYCTGKGLTTGSGRDKKHSYRRGIQTPHWRYRVIRMDQGC